MIKFPVDLPIEEHCTLKNNTKNAWSQSVLVFMSFTNNFVDMMEKVLHVDQWLIKYLGTAIELLL